MRIEIRIINEVKSKNDKSNKRIKARAITSCEYEYAEYIFHRLSPYGIDKQEWQDKDNEYN